jgi:hypothetical protein
MLFQMASFAVGQKHMADIQRELEEIKATVQSIATFQQNERLSSLTSILRYVSEVAGPVLAGEAPPEGLKAALESHHRKLLEAEIHLMTDIRNGIEEILKVRDPSTFGTDGGRKSIADHLTLLTRHYDEAFLSIRARAANLQLAAMCNCVGEQLRTERNKDIRASLQQLKEDGQLVKETTTRMRQRISQLYAITDFDTTISQRKLELIASVGKLVDRVKGSREAIERELDRAEGFFQPLDQPTRLLLKVDDGYIVGMQTV